MSTPVEAKSRASCAHRALCMASMASCGPALISEHSFRPGISWITTLQVITSMTVCSQVRSSGAVAKAVLHAFIKSRSGDTCRLSQKHREPCVVHPGLIVLLQCKAVDFDLRISPGYTGQDTADAIMLYYSKALWGICMFTIFHGSAFPRAVPLAGIAAAATALLHAYVNDELQRAWRHTESFHIFAFIVALMVICRCASGTQAGKACWRAGVINGTCTRSLLSCHS